MDGSQTEGRCKMRLPEPFARISLACVLFASLSAVAHADERERFFRLSEVVYQEKSLYRNIIVAEGDGHRCMTFGRRHARQSCIKLSDPDRLVFDYTRGLLASLFLSRQLPKRVLVIGLGGGSLPNALHDLDDGMRIDSVELDPAVVDVAKQFFAYRTDERSRIHVDDGRVFVRKRLRGGERYDLIILDAFDKDSVPEHLMTREFFSQLRDLLSPKGVLAANTFAGGRLARHEAATYQAVFGPMLKLMPHGGNRILLAQKDGFASKEDIVRRGRELQEQLQAFGVSANELLNLIRPLESASDIPILTDQFSPSNLLL